MSLIACSECGKRFLPATQHLYKVPKVGKQCSYTCWNKAIERHKTVKRTYLRRPKN